MKVLRMTLLLSGGALMILSQVQPAALALPDAVASTCRSTWAREGTRCGPASHRC